MKKAEVVARDTFTKACILWVGAIAGVFFVLTLIGAICAVCGGPHWLLIAGLVGASIVTVWFFAGWITAVVMEFDYEEDVYYKYLPDSEEE